ncbi:MAG: hypothetical protein V1664_01855 [Candidatus Uhrbacteria bacterium]
MENKKNIFRRISTGLMILMVFLGGQLFVPQAAKAGLLDNWLSPTTLEGRALILELAAKENEGRAYGQLPEAADGQPERIIKIPITAYSSEVGQTDSTPFITASGTTVRRGVIAANFLPIGTRVRFPDLYGDEVFIVEDRMNQRYNKRIDIWMEETADARNFGLQWTTVEVF